MDDLLASASHIVAMCVSFTQAIAQGVECVSMGANYLLQRRKPITAAHTRHLLLQLLKVLAGLGLGTEFRNRPRFRLELTVHRLRIVCNTSVPLL